MIGIDAHTRVYIAAEPLDFRRQIDGLALAVQETLALDPFSAHLFVFRNRQADKLKLLVLASQRLRAALQATGEGALRVAACRCRSAGVRRTAGACPPARRGRYRRARAGAPAAFRRRLMPGDLYGSDGDTRCVSPALAG